MKHEIEVYDGVWARVTTSGAKKGSFSSKKSGQVNDGNWKKFGNMTWVAR